MPCPEAVPGPGVANEEREKAEKRRGTCPAIFLLKHGPLSYDNLVLVDGNCWRGGSKW